MKKKDGGESISFDGYSWQLRLSIDCVASKYWCWRGAIVNFFSSGTVLFTLPVMDGYLAVTSSIGLAVAVMFIFKFVGAIHGTYHGTNWYWRSLYSSDDRDFSIECVWCDVLDEYYSITFVEWQFSKLFRVYGKWIANETFQTLKKGNPVWLSPNGVYSFCSHPATARY